MFDDAPQERTSSPSSKKSFNLSSITSKLPMIAVIFLLVFALGAAGFFFIKYQGEKSRAQQLLGASTGDSPEEVKKLIESVGKLIELPKGEQPTIATVSNREKLSGQDFFKNAQNGDRVLIYEKAKVAIIYRPSTNKIVNYATNINVNQPSVAPTSEVTGEPSSTVTLTPTPTFAPVVTSVPTTEPTTAPIQ